MSKFGFDIIVKDFERLKKTLPIKVGNDALRIYVGAFAKQSWNGVNWQEVKRRIPGTPEYKYPKKRSLGRRTRAILIGKGSGRMRRDVVNSLRNATMDNIHFQVEASYAVYHNEGEGKMPKRKFMGSSLVLDRAIEKRIVDEINKIWK